MYKIARKRERARGAKVDEHLINKLLPQKRHATGHTLAGFCIFAVHSSDAFFFFLLLLTKLI